VTLHCDYVVGGECREDVSKPKCFRVTLHDDVACDESIQRFYSLLLRNLAIRIQSEGESVVGEFGNVDVAREANWMRLELSSDGLIDVDDTWRLSAGD
jgi:hypothetical protein